MKREGRQHGMVRCQSILPPPLNTSPDQKIINKFDSPPTAGFHTVVLHRPNNHSKYTSKCRKARCSSCHVHPVSKSRDKAKGAHKLNSCDVALNHRLVSWRVVDKGYGFNYTGKSASGILNYLSGSYSDEIDDYGDEENEVEDFNHGTAEVLIGPSNMLLEHREEDAEETTAMEEDEDLGFYKVGFFLESLDGEDWCMVMEM